MSYSFRVRKSDGTLQFVDGQEALEQAAKSIPDGAVFTVNGHEPVEGTSPAGSVGVNLVVRTTARDVFRGSAMGSYNTETVG